MVLADKYPQTRISQLGDASGGYRGMGETRPHEAWGTLEALSDVSELAEMSSEEFNFETLYLVAGKRHPEITFAQFDNAEDEVQLRFLDISGIETKGLAGFLDANHEDILAGMPNFRYYMPGGEMHTILGRSELYTTNVGGELFRDWLSQLVSGEAVKSVRCSACAEAEHVEDPHAPMEEQPS